MKRARKVRLRKAASAATTISLFVCFHSSYPPLEWVCIRGNGAACRVSTRNARVRAPQACFSQKEASGCERIREGEAPAEPVGRKLLIQNGSAGASPSQRDAIGIFSQLPTLGRGDLNLLERSAESHTPQEVPSFATETNQMFHEPCPAAG